MTQIFPEQYLQSVIRELVSSYDNYRLVLRTLRRRGPSWKRRSIENFLVIEKDSFLQIQNREKVLSRWLPDCEEIPLSLSAGLSSVEQQRIETLREKEMLMKEIRSAMNKLEQEQKKLRIPRSKPMQKESVPALIDITL
jgi:hypothetical protein